MAEALQKPPRWLKDSLGKINPPRPRSRGGPEPRADERRRGLRLAKGVSLDKPVHVIISTAAASLRA